MGWQHERLRMCKTNIERLELRLASSTYEAEYAKAELAHQKRCEISLIRLIDEILALRKEQAKLATTSDSEAP